MGTVKIENKGNPVFVGDILCRRNQNTVVDEQALIDFCNTPSGAALFNATVFAVDGDMVKRKEVEGNAVKAQALAEARQELTPILEKELREKIEKEYEKKIHALNKKIESLNMSSHEPQKTQKKKESGDSKQFVFDPELHIIEHRGAGNYFVMDLNDKKLYGPITDDEKQAFADMQKES